MRILIIGAGPAGLACARALDQLGHKDFRILEAGEEPGGLARSVRDAAGFTWDLGGHVVFSHYGEFDRLLAEVMGEEVHHHDRSSFVRFGEVWVPYPFQMNLRHLPAEIAAECLTGLRDARGGEGARSFADWMRGVFGEGITRHFMAPYNRKVWATDPVQMDWRWIGERVAEIDHARAARNLALGRDDVAWGPNNRFVFPARGGTGEIYRRIAEPLRERLHLRAPVTAVDPERRVLRTADGGELSYDAVVSTMPLDLLVASLSAAPDPVRAAAAQLRHNSVYMVGVGYEAPLADERSWMYFPGRDVPFYRATNFAKYAAANVPGADTGRFCAYMTETAFSDQQPVPRAGLEQRVESGLRAAGVIAGRPPVASIHVEEIPYAYPVPTLGRDAALAVIQPWLEAQGIYSRGRFGAWRYEIGNMDHAVKMGIDVAHRVLAGTPEPVFAG
jgi:UDP-galactopyranose mutase